MAFDAEPEERQLPKAGLNMGFFSDWRSCCLPCGTAAGAIGRASPCQLQQESCHYWRE